MTLTIEQLLDYERLVQNSKYPLYLPIRSIEGRPMSIIIDKREYQWVHKLVDVKNGKGLYTTGLKEAEP